MKTMKRMSLFCITFILLMSFALNAQDQWDNYTYSNAVLAIEHDGDYWWLGTEGGLVKFNETAHSIQVFNRGNSDILTNRIPLLSKDENGNLWLGTPYGVSKFDGKNFTNYTTENSDLLNNNIKHLAYGKYSGLWVVTDSALTFFDGTNWKHFRVDSYGDSLKQISAIYAVSSGLLFAVGSKVEFIQPDGTINDMGFGITAHISGVGFDYMNNVVVCSYDNGFWISSDQGWNHYYNGNTPMHTDNIFQLSVAPNGDLYFNLGQNGVTVLHSDGTWNLIPDQDGDPLNYLIYVYAEDKIAMSLAWPFLGFVIADHPDEWTYTFSDNINLNIFPVHSNEVNTMVIRNGKKYIASWGVDVLDENNHLIRKYDYNDGDFSPLYNPTKYLAVDVWENIWCGDDVNGELIKINGDRIIPITGDSVKIENMKVTGLQWETTRLPDGSLSGTLWASFYGSDYEGIAYLDSVWHKFPNEHPKYPGEMNAFVRDASGVMWIADHNIYSYDGNEFKSYWWDVPIKEATCVVRDKAGNLWFGGKPDESAGWPGGLLEFDGSNWTLFNKSNSSLPDDYVTSLACDTTGNIWIGTFWGGLAKLAPDGTWSVFNRDNSPLDNNGIQKVVVDTLTNNLWILNRDAGVFIYNENGVTSIPSIKATPNAPGSLTLYPNYPNPFNPQTTIRFKMARSGHISLKIFDLNGRLVRTLVDGFKPAGEYRISFDGNGLASGIYWCRLTNGTVSQTRKMVLVR